MEEVDASAALGMLAAAAEPTHKDPAEPSPRLLQPQSFIAEVPFLFKGGLLPPVQDSFDRFAKNHDDPYFASQVSSQARPSSAPRPMPPFSAATMPPSSGAHLMRTRPSSTNHASSPTGARDYPQSLAFRLYSASLAPQTPESAAEMLVMVEELRALLTPRSNSARRLIRPTSAASGLMNFHPASSRDVLAHTPFADPVSLSLSSLPCFSSASSSAPNPPAGNPPARCHWCKTEISSVPYQGPLGLPLCGACGQIYLGLRASPAQHPSIRRAPASLRLSRSTSTTP